MNNYSDFAKELKTKILSLPQDKYEEFLAELVSFYIEPGYDEMVLNLTDKNRLSLIRFIVLLNTKFKQAGKATTLVKISNDTIDSEFGFVLKNGENEIDCSAEKLLSEKIDTVTEILLKL